MGVHRVDSFSREHHPEARPAAEPLPKSKEHHQSHPLRSLPTVSAPSRLSCRRGPRLRPTGCWPVPTLPPLSLLLRDSLKAGRASFHPAKSFLSHSMCSSLFIMRAIASSLSCIHLCTAPVAASATTCKFLVTPVPRSLRLFSERSSTSAGNTPPTAGASVSYPSSSSTL